MTLYSFLVSSASLFIIQHTHELDIAILVVVVIFFFLFLFFFFYLGGNLRRLISNLCGDFDKSLFHVTGNAPMGDCLSPGISIPILLQLYREEGKQPTSKVGLLIWIS